MNPHEILKGIYQEHGCDVARMVETLVDLDVPLGDVDLLSRMQWHFPADRIATERERLGLPAVHPLLHWKLPPPPPDWLTPAVIVKMFELALSDEYKEDADDEPVNGSALILPA